MAPSGLKVLVVEDDEETLNVISRTLASDGYDVIWARSGPDALKLLTRIDDAIDLVITDVVLPEMSGSEVVDTVSRKYPRAGAIYVSAYDEETVRLHGVDPETMPFLSKPYQPAELLELVRTVLAGR